jgi:hypothetical protein
MDGLLDLPDGHDCHPVEAVWELLADPTLYDTWWDAHTERIVPEGKATPGQVIYAKATGLGRTWDVTLRVDAVNPERHQVQLHITLPLGVVNDATISAAATGSASSRLQFG